MSATPPQATWNKLETKGILHVRSQEDRSTIAFLPVVRNFNETKPKSSSPTRCSSSLRLHSAGRALSARFYSRLGLFIASLLLFIYLLLLLLPRDLEPRLLRLSISLARFVFLAFSQLLGQLRTGDQVGSDCTHRLCPVNQPLGQNKPAGRS